MGEGMGSSWELYFEETEKGRIPLSHTGSGLKTILLVLAFLHLVPHMEGKSLSSYLFGFEELENNLHPALLRRLLLYLRDTAVEKGCHFFLTTHSSVAIDLFASDDKAQILHITHDRTCASVRHVTTYVENKGVLDDLNVRASDLLQSNGVVWLEGPSDRLYFNRWVELWTGGELREGAHYQCVFYGGRLLAHLSADDPDVDSGEVVKILRVNRNAVILIDSDKMRPNESLNATKQRIISEVEAFAGMAWVSAGKEVENYIPAQAISSLYGSNAATSLERYGDFSEFLDGLSDDEGKRFLRNKVLYAEKICPHITSEDMIGVFDLKARINEACNRIRSWNGSRQ
jgi:putative ATP-dependent endonuclease of the OLD family